MSHTRTGTITPSVVCVWGGISQAKRAACGGTLQVIRPVWYIAGQMGWVGRCRPWSGWVVAGHVEEGGGERGAESLLRGNGFETVMWGREEGETLQVAEAARGKGRWTEEDQVAATADRRSSAARLRRGPISLASSAAPPAQPAGASGPATVQCAVASSAPLLASSTSLCAYLVRPALASVVCGLTFLVPHSCGRLTCCVPASCTRLTSLSAPLLHQAL